MNPKPVVVEGNPANMMLLQMKEGGSMRFRCHTGHAYSIESLLADGEEIPLGSLKPGDSFGEAALAEGGTRNASVRCSTAVDVLRIDRNDFLQLTQMVPDMRRYIEMTGRNRALQSFLYQFSNFGRLPAPIEAPPDTAAPSRQ